MSITCLLIGVSKYKSDDIDDLPFCKNDLSKLKETLKLNLGINEKNIFVLGEKPEEATRANILRFIKSAKSLTDSSETLLVYFTGHGVSLSNNGYIITYDTEPDIISDTSIPIARLQNELKEVNGKNKVMFIDSCFSGAHFGKSTGTSESFFEKLDELINEGWSIFSSCKGDEISWFHEEEEISVFTHFLIEGFKGNAIKNGNSKKLSLEDLVTYVTRNVAAWSLKNRSKSQTPTIRNERVGSLHFEVKKILKEDKLKEESTKKNNAVELTIRTNYEAPTGFELNDNLLLGSSLRSYGTLNPMESKWVSYSEEEQKKKAEKKFNETIKKLHAIFLNHINPSQINTENKEHIKLPFGELKSVIDESSFELSFTTKVSSDDKELDSLLFEIDDQDIVKWKSVTYKFDNTFDLDKLRKIIIDKNYKIEEYDPFEKIIKVNMTPEDTSPFYMTFKNLENQCLIEISESRELREDFLELIPATEMIEIFKISFEK